MNPQRIASSLHWVAFLVSDAELEHMAKGAVVS